MRIISGKARGLKLDTPDGMDTRPTLDRVKEPLFSMILPHIADSQVLDLFAGSGALGIEAVSRHAAHCTFLDKSKDAINVINRNISKARFADQTDVILGDSMEFLKSTKCKYDVIFIDPPYKSELYLKVLAIIKERGLLNEGGIITLECDRAQIINADGFEVIKERTYGSVRVYVLEDLVQK